MRKKAKFGNFLICMVLLIGSTIGFYFFDLERAKDDYRIENQIPDIRHPADTGWFGHDEYYTKAEITIEQLARKHNTVLILTVIFLFLYPLFGRLLVLFAQGLTFMFDTLAKDLNINSDSKQFSFGNWSPNVILYLAVLPPLTAFAIGLLLIANLLMFIYRFLI
jgi:hypothetical protein